MSPSPRFRAVLGDFVAYQPGRTPVSSSGKSHKLSSNESPFAPLPSVIEVIAEEDAHVIILAGQPLHEPVVQYGPFVMNSQADGRPM